MIFKSSYFNKEMRQAYIENHISQKKQFTFGLFIGLVTFALHFLLQTVYESVLTEAVPEIMLPSFFSVGFTYTLISFLFFSVYFLFYFEYLTFAEIHKNRWYMLIQMGYSPSKMIFSKLAARLYSVFTIYSVGFLVSMGLTVFLKYPFVFAYMPTLYIAGLIDTLFIVLISMTASLLLHSAGNARYFVFGSAIFLFFLKFATGFYAIVSDRVLMQNAANLFLFERSPYLVILAGISLIAIGLCTFYARNSAGYFFPKKTTDLNIARQDYKTGKIKFLRAGENAPLYRLMDGISSALLIIFIAVTLLFNVLVLAISAASPEKEVTIQGIIPYVFQSTTMQPDIMKNDLAFFRKLDKQVPIKTDDIVIFKDQNSIYVERVKSVENGLFTVDIDYYPQGSEKDSMVKVIGRDSIYGVYESRSRWLGSLIMFANTLFGRILFLLLPAVFIFFYKPITKFFSKLSATGVKNSE